MSILQPMEALPFNALRASAGMRFTAGLHRKGQSHMSDAPDTALVKAVRKRLTEESAWTQAGYAALPDGRGTDSYNPDAVCWCLGGARDVEGKKSGDFAANRHDAFARALGFRNSDEMFTWNDAPERTQAEVVAKLREAAALAAAEGQ